MPVEVIDASVGAQAVESRLEAAIAREQDAIDGANDGRLRQHLEGKVHDDAIE